MPLGHGARVPDVPAPAKGYNPNSIEPAQNYGEGDGFIAANRTRGPASPQTASITSFAPTAAPAPCRYRSRPVVFRFSLGHRRAGG